MANNPIYEIKALDWVNYQMIFDNGLMVVKS